MGKADYMRPSWLRPAAHVDDDGLVIEELPPPRSEPPPKTARDVGRSVYLPPAGELARSWLYNIVKYK